MQANLAIVERVRDVAERVGATPAQVALAWVVAQGRRVIPIPGTKSPKYLRENVMAGDMALSDEDLVMLNGAPAPEGSRY